MPKAKPPESLIKIKVFGQDFRIGSGAMARAHNIQIIAELLKNGVSEYKIAHSKLQMYFRPETIYEYIRIAKIPEEGEEELNYDKRSGEAQYTPEELEDIAEYGTTDPILLKQRKRDKKRNKE